MTATPLLWGSLALVVSGVGLLAVVSRKKPGAAGKHVVGSKGWVEEDPRVLALAAGVSDNVYALASMMVSEAGGDLLLQIAVGHVAVNEARARGTSVFRLLTRAGRRDGVTKQFDPHESNDFYGPQNVGPRYASTKLAPTAAALENAAEVLSGAVPDPTDGARQWDAPGAQDSLLGKAAGYLKSSAEVAASRSKNNELVMVPGITSTRFWRPKNA